jgi:hypothetical protein
MQGRCGVRVGFLRLAHQVGDAVMTYLRRGRPDVFLSYGQVMDDVGLVADGAISAH